MKFGVHAGLWMKAWQDDPLPILDIAADLGFDGVEGSEWTAPAASARLPPHAGWT